IWGPSYASGISVSGQLGKFDYAVEMKNASLSSRPESWYVTENGFENPTFSGRFGFRTNEAWNFGLSASEGPYFRREAETTLPPGRDIGDYREFVVGQDASFAWRHLQVWVEFYEARFEVPRAGNADTFAYYIEAKYKFTPQLFAAIRWNQQLFGDVSGPSGGSIRWSDDLARIDLAAGYRFTSHTQLKIQYSYQHETTGQGNDNELVARVNALGRRYPEEPTLKLRVGDLTLDLASHEVHRGSRHIHLSARELMLLKVLVREPGRVFTRTELCERVWEHPHEYDTKLVEVFIG